MNYHMTIAGSSSSTGVTEDPPGVYPADPEAGTALAVVVPWSAAIEAGIHAGDLETAIETEAARLGFRY